MFSCFCWCKDTNFSANHNDKRRHDFCFRVVFAGAKILIFQQITTTSTVANIVTGCFCWCKDTNFSANHNAVEHSTIRATLFLLVQRY